MEAGHRLPTLGGAGAVWIWRAALHFLSSGIVDTGSRAPRRFSMDSRSGHLYFPDPCRGGGLYVSAVAAIAGTPRRHLRCGVVRGQSLSPCHRLLAKRLCRAAGEFPASFIVVAR